MAEVIYEANFSRKAAINIITPLKVDLYDSETKEFINLSIEYAKKAKSNIMISRDMDIIRIKIHIAAGLFFGGFKKTFLSFAAKSRNFLIFPMSSDSNFALEISAYYDMLGEKEKI